MMKQRHFLTDRGQTLVIIAFAAIGLFAFAALAIDGSMVFSDRRHAQNAADTAALDSALSKTRGGDWEQEGLDRATSNGYNDNGTSNEVEVYSPPLDGNYAGNSQYIQVKITSHVKTFFARILGFQQITNRVDAVARAVPGTISPMFAGNAVVSLAPADCKSMMYQGNASTTVQGGGIFVNSECPSAAFFNSSSAAQLTAPCLQAVGGIQAQPGVLNIPSNCIQSGSPNVTAYSYPPDNIVFPNIVCPSSGSQSGNTLNPGTYSGNFPPNGVTHLNAGTYCVNGDFRVNGGETLTGHNVIIIMVSGDVVFNGGAEIELSGPPGPQSEENPYGGLFLYMPMTNSGTITINGNSESGFTGTILAPAAEITIDGTGSAGLHGQVIGYTVDLSGTSSTSIVYNDEENWDAPVPPQIELAQ
ncbi:MAG TPA: Tad domain-containing protein [Anaerolineales bacterium]|nr:Tad domain-containing protein [Anaerolineales bacterium]